MIVMHNNPDLDAVMAAWILVRFDQSRYGDATLTFVPAGTTYKNMTVDADPEVTHVDVGWGKFDHHQQGVMGTCASKLVWESLIAEGQVGASDTALKSMVEHALEIDHFADSTWEEARESRFAFTLSEIIPALHRLQIYDNQAVTRAVFIYLDGVYQRLKDIGQAKQAILSGEEFSSAWGRGIAVLTGADDVSKIAQKDGFDIVVIQDPKKGYLKIKLKPGTKRNLDDLYAKITLLEPATKWFYHNSGLMLFNGSDKGAPRETSVLKLQDLVKLIKEVE